MKAFLLLSILGSFLWADSLNDYFSVEEIARSHSFYQRQDFLLWIRFFLTEFVLMLLLFTRIFLKIDSLWDRLYKKLFSRLSPFTKRLKLNFGILPCVIFKVFCWIFFIECYEFLVKLPINYFLHQLSLEYQMTGRNFLEYYQDSMPHSILRLFRRCSYAILLMTFYKVSTRWWWIPLALISIFIQFMTNQLSQAAENERDGVILQKPLEAGELRTQLEQAIAKIGVPVSEIKYSDESKRTKAPNAWVLSASGKNVLFFTDTCFQFSNPALVNICFHELAHIHFQHPQQRRCLEYSLLILKYLLVALGLSFFLPRRFSDSTAYQESNQSLVFVCCVCLLFPIVTVTLDAGFNLCIQQQELEAERYAVQLSNDPESMIQVRKQMALESLLRLEEPWWWFLESHPNILRFFSAVRK
ncbi:MAG: M48 family metalloprotease [Planctomycetota bacterium]